MNLKVLLIEDDENSNFLFSYILKKGEFEVSSFFSAEDALEYLKTNIPDIIVSDILLTGINGRVFIEMVKMRPEFKKTCAVAISALVTVEDKHKALQAGFDDFIEKPIQAMQFADQIKQIYLRLKKDNV